MKMLITQTVHLRPRPARSSFSTMKTVRTARRTMMPTAAADSTVIKKTMRKRKNRVVFHNFLLLFNSQTLSNCISNPFLFILYY